MSQIKVSSSKLQVSDALPKWLIVPTMCFMGSLGEVGTVIPICTEGTLRLTLFHSNQWAGSMQASRRYLTP